ncbi:hypothetical protein D3C87_1381090 [compost metagenome]
MRPFSSVQKRFSHFGGPKTVTSVLASGLPSKFRTKLLAPAAVGTSSRSSLACVSVRPTLAPYLTSVSLNCIGWARRTSPFPLAANATKSAPFSEAFSTVPSAAVTTGATSTLPSRPSCFSRTSSAHSPKYALAGPSAPRSSQTKCACAAPALPIRAMAAKVLAKVILVPLVFSLIKTTGKPRGRCLFFIGLNYNHSHYDSHRNLGRNAKRW